MGVCFLLSFLVLLLCAWIVQPIQLPHDNNVEGVRRKKNRPLATAKSKLSPSVSSLAQDQNRIRKVSVQTEKEKLGEKEGDLPCSSDPAACAKWKAQFGTDLPCPDGVTTSNASKLKMNGGITPFDSAVRNPLPSSSAKDVIWSVGKTAIVTRELDCQSTHPLAVVTPTYDSGFPGPGVKFLSGPSPLTPLFGKKGGHISVEEVAKAGEMFVSGTFVTVVPEPEGALAPDFYAALHIRVHRKTGTSLTDTNGGKESLGEGGDTLQGERVADVVFGVQSPQESLDSFYVSGKDPTQVEVFEGAGPVIFRRPVEVLVKSAGKAVSAGNVMFRHSMDDVVEDVPQTAVDAGGSPLKLREKLWKVQFRLGADGKVSVAAVRRLTYIAFDFDHTLDLSNFADCEMEIDVLGLQGQEKGKRQLILGGLSVESEPCLTSPGTPNVPAPASNGTM